HTIVSGQSASLTQAKTPLGAWLLHADQVPSPSQPTNTATAARASVTRIVCMIEAPRIRQELSANNSGLQIQLQTDLDDLVRGDSEVAIRRNRVAREKCEHALSHFAHRAGRRGQKGVAAQVISHLIGVER